MSIGPAAPVRSLMPNANVNPAGDAKDAKLRETARHLEGVFVQQMYKAMRDTVPTDGAFSGGTGEEMFTGMLDERLATDTPAQWQQHGLSEAIYRHLRAAQSSVAVAAPSPLPIVPE